MQTAKAKSQGKTRKGRYEALHPGERGSCHTRHRSDRGELRVCRRRTWVPGPVIWWIAGLQRWCAGHRDGDRRRQPARGQRSRVPGTGHRRHRHLGHWLCQPVHGQVHGSGFGAQEHVRFGLHVGHGGYAHGQRPGLHPSRHRLSDASDQPAGDQPPEPAAQRARAASVCTARQGARFTGDQDLLAEDRLEAGE